MGILGKGKPNFLKLDQKGDIEGLEKALKDKEPQVREMAIGQLFIIAGGQGYHRASIVREKACWAISKAFLEGEDASMRIKAAVYLKQLYKRGELPQELKKAVRKSGLDKIFDEKGKV